METKIKELKDSIIAKIEELFDTVAKDQDTGNDKKIIQIPDKIKLVFTNWNTGIINPDGQLLNYNGNVGYIISDSNNSNGNITPHKFTLRKFKNVPIGRVFLSNGLEFKNDIENYYIKMSDEHSLYWNLQYGMWFPQSALLALDEDVYLAQLI